MSDLYDHTLRGCIRTLEGKVERQDERIALLQTVNVAQARELIRLRLMLQVATDMAEALRTKLAEQEEDEPMIPMQLVVDRAVGRERAKWN